MPRAYTVKHNWNLCLLAELMAEQRPESKDVAQHLRSSRWKTLIEDYNDKEYHAKGISFENFKKQALDKIQSCVARVINRQDKSVNGDLQVATSIDWSVKSILESKNALADIVDSMHRKSKFVTPDPPALAHIQPETTSLSEMKPETPSQDHHDPLYVQARHHTPLVTELNSSHPKKGYELVSTVTPKKVKAQKRSSQEEEEVRAFERKRRLHQEEIWALEKQTAIMRRNITAVDHMEAIRRLESHVASQFNVTQQERDLLNIMRETNNLKSE